MIDSWRFAGASRSADTSGETPTGISAFSTLELRALLRTTSESVLVVDDTGQVIKAAAGESTQWVANQLLGKRLDEALDETSSRAFYEALLVSRRYQRTETVTFSLHHEDRQHSFVATAYPLEQGAVLCAVRDITRQHAVDTALATRFEIERLLGRCSYRFINIHPDRIDLAIDQTLGDLGIYCGVDRAYIYQQTEQTLSNTHGWRRSGLKEEQPAYGRRLHAGQLPWLARQLYSQELVTVDSLDQLPQEALLERNRLQRAGVNALVAVPIIYSGDVRGFLAVDRGADQPRWSREQLHLLRSAGEIFASALQRKQSERRIFRLAYYDRLTGLPNRQLLRRRVGQLCQSMDQAFAVVLLDLNDAGMINDLLGHDVGDLLLKTISSRLEAFLPHGHPLARWGGDEFIFTLPLSAGDIGEQVTRQVDRLRDLLGKTVRVAGHELRVSASIGVACHPEHGGDVDSLVRYAEMALRQAKQQNRNGLVLYDQGLQQRAASRSRLENRLRQAVERKAFRLNYQPMVCMHDGALVAAEALVRWNDEELGRIPPDDFIGLAEETGLIVPLGEWVLEQTCWDLGAWQREGLTLPRISVNVSGHQLLDDRFPKTLESLLRRYRLPGHALELEITESTLMEREKGCLPLLQRLRELGISIAVDDFGTGYSSLSKIKHMPVNILKIDRSFIQDIFTDDNDKAIVIAIVAMAHQLNLRVVAEGVETEEQLAFLRETGCDLVQGFLIGRPCSTQHLRELLLRGQALLSDQRSMLFDQRPLF